MPPPSSSSTLEGDSGILLHCGAGWHEVGKETCRMALAENAEGMGQSAFGLRERAGGCWGCVIEHMPAQLSQMSPHWSAPKSQPLNPQGLRMSCDASAKFLGEKTLKYILSSMLEVIEQRY